MDRSLIAYVRTVVSLVSAVLLIVSLTGCSTGSGQSHEWTTGDDGRFHTYDLVRAREEIPFEFVYPSYLPSDLTGQLLISGYLAGASPDSQTCVELLDQQVDDEPLTLISIVQIYACDYTRIPMNPENNTGYKMLDINDVAVTQLSVWMDARKGDGSYILDGFSFWWNKEGIFYEVLVYGYDDDEAIKIVESMVEQY